MERIPSHGSEDSFEEAEHDEVQVDDGVITQVGIRDDDGTSAAVHQVNVTGITGGTAETVTTVGILHGNIMVSRDHRLKSLKDKTLKEIKEWTKEMLHTSSVDKVMHMIQSNQPWITITGNAGEGKTTTGYLVLQQLILEKHQVFRVDTPEDYFTIVRKASGSVIMMNDVLGAFAFDLSALSRWEPVFQDRVARMKVAKDSELGLILFVSRTNVVEGARKHLGHYEKDMFGEERSLNLSSSQPLAEEKMSILEHYLQRAGIEDVNSDVKGKIVSVSCPHGFPHCCKIYTDLRKSHTTPPDIEAFFSNPLAFLAQTTKVLVRKANLKSLFKELLRNNGRISTFLTEDNTKRDEIKEAAEELKGSYVKLDEGKIQFAHPSVHESVALCIGWIDPLFAVQHYDVSFILQKVKFTDASDSKSDDDLHLSPSKEIIGQLCTRFAPDILGKEFAILQHEVCKMEDVCSQLITNCVEKKSVKMHLKDLFTQKESKKININSKDTNGNTMLHVAHRSNNESAIETLLTLGADVNIKDQQGNSFFHLACMADNANANLVRELVNRGAEINRPFPDGSTALHWAYQQKEDEIFEYLIEKGIDVNLNDGNGKTVLQHMCKEGASMQEVLLLLNNGAKVNKSKILTPRTNHDDDEDSDSENKSDRQAFSIKPAKRKGKTALHYLCSCNGDIKVIDSLIHHGANMNKTDNRGRTPLHYACGHQHLEAVKCLLRHNANVKVVDMEGNTPLHYLYDYDNKEGVQMLLEHGADVNSSSMEGKTLLHYHCQRGELDLTFIQLLLKHGTDVNKSRKHEYSVTHLLKSRLKKSGDAEDTCVNRKGKTALHYICKREQSEAKHLTMKLLLHNGADTDMKDGQGKSPLHYVCERDDEQAFNMLVEHGSDVNITDNEGKAVLFITFEEAQTERLTKILKHGTEVNNADKCGKTLLHYVCEDENTNLNVLELLLQNDVDVNKRRRYPASLSNSSSEENVSSKASQLVRTMKRDGKTPLHYACNKIRIDLNVVEMLLNKGASVNMADRHGMVPLHYLMGNEKTNSDDLQLLISFGADLNKVNSLGQTALHFLCSRRNVDPDLLKLLLQHDVNIKKADKGGKTAMDYLGNSDSDEAAREIRRKHEEDISTAG